VSGASVNTTNVDSKVTIFPHGCSLNFELNPTQHNTMGSSPAAMAAKNQAAKNSAVLGKVRCCLLSAPLLCHFLSRLQS
jgi:hypothetical protein